MTGSPTGSTELFDDFDANYEAALARGVSATGESAEYYLEERVKWVGRLLAERGAAAGKVLDFGCGTGAAAAPLLRLKGAREVVGIDVSEGLLARARAEHGGPSVSFANVKAHPADASFDLAYTNGVFHHIPVAQRAGAVKVVFDSLRAGGLYAFWENNPWNPGTRYVMSRIEFDRDAITIPPPEARALLRSAGFEVLSTTSRFFFPRMLAALRPLEGMLSPIPLGGQYLVLCRRNG